MGLKPPEWKNRPSMAICVEEEQRSSLPPEKHTRILGKGNDETPHYVSWTKWYFGFVIGLLWGIFIVLYLQAIL